MAIDLIRMLMDSATASGSKSTVLTDLRWYLAISSAALLGSFGISAPSWVSVLFACALVTGIALYFLAYIYFGLKSPDSLRSEKFTLSKMAIERSIIGDNIAGMRDPMKPAGLIEEKTTMPDEAHK